ncbi:MAG: uracil-DNA glycosylase family protein [Gemmatimonadaceae bacterium]
MSVEDVMRLLGAGASAGRRATGSEAARAPASDRAVPPSAATERPDAPARGDSAPPGDWREALRAIEPRGQVGGAPRTDRERAPAPRPAPRPAVPSDASPGAPDSGTAAGSVPAVRSDDASQVAPTAATPDAPSRDDSAPSSDDASDRPAPTARAMPASPPGKLQDSSHATMPFEQIPTGLVVGSPAHELFGGPESPWRTLADIAEAARNCQSCTLYKTARQAVPGEGNPEADFVCVGEAPGATEDEQGKPFVGQAGQLLTKILAAINLTREDVFICNVLKHRPPGNRNPTPEEVTACSPYLVRQIEILKPKVIVALGTFAAQTLLQTKEPIGKLRGRIHRYYGVPLIVTYHPAALLRNPSWKRPTWEDVQLARRLYDRARDA